MQFYLDIHELGWLLDACLRGSHLRAETVRKFVDLFFDRLSEQERYDLYETTLRLTYSYEKEFKPSSRCCGADIAFMCRYDPDNQYLVTSHFEEKENTIFAFKMGDKYYVDSSRFIAPEHIIKVEKFEPEVERTEFELNFKGRRH